MHLGNAKNSKAEQALELAASIFSVSALVGALQC